MPITATQCIHRMRGGAQSQLMLGHDGALWVVKFRNNPQHTRVLANELLATQLAEHLGLSVPRTDIVDVSEWLIANTSGMMVDTPRGQPAPCSPGLNFGSRFVGGLMPGQVVDYLPDEQMLALRNLHEFCGILALDKWTGNCNGRQAVYERKQRERKYRAIFIDQGFCFNAGEWTFPDIPLRGTFPRNLVYANVRGWDAFEPWLTRIERFPPDKLWLLAEQVPPDWYGGDTRNLEQLCDQLLARRTHVRECINAFRHSHRDPFPNWGATATITVPHTFELPPDATKFVM